MLGEPVWGNRALMRSIGYCPEHEGTYEDLTGLEMVTALTELHGFSHDDARARAEKMFGVVDLKEPMHRRLGEYSKGMRQRAKLAQAMAHDPEVVFLDEPLTGCDPLARVRILEVIADLARARALHHRLVARAARDRDDDLADPAHPQRAAAAPRATCTRFARSSTRIRTRCASTATSRARSPRSW